ncbi:MAG: putative NTPase family [Actinomycetia bacterium]|nr:putative NTPase family [Actinomycetes bacterium]
MRDLAQSLQSRCDAAVSLARADDSRGTNFLRTVSANQAAPEKSRLRATRLLRSVSDPEAGRFLKLLVRKLPQAPRGILHSGDLDVALGVRAQLADSSATVESEVRKMAAYALAQFRDPAATRNLVTVTSDAHSPFHVRRQAITSVAFQGAVDELGVLAEDADIDSTVRCWAAEQTAWLADPRGAEVLVALVGDESVDSYTRRRAAFFLARLGDSRGTRLLAHLATDPNSTGDARGTATQLLTQMRYVEDLQSIILALDASDETRSYAIDILASHREIDALLDLRQRRDLPFSARQRIALVAQKVRPRKGKPTRH